MGDDAAPAGAAAAPPAPASARVNGPRLWSTLMEMAQVGAIAGDGVCRLAGSDEDRVGRDLFVDWCREAGLAVTVDRMGNVFALRAGRDRTAAPVLVGSHLDSQPTGGRFDGVWGVLAGLEVVRALDDAGIETERGVQVVSWTNEEGARFAPAMLASGVFAGRFDLEYGLSRTDAGGRTLGDDLVRIGYSGELPCGGWAPAAYLEAHIEQGPILEAEGTAIGVVTGVQGIRWFDVGFRGAEAHAGTTPMDRRRDAMVAASRLVVAVDELAVRHAPDARCTVGVCTVSPASRNTVVGSAELTVDLRHPDAATLEAMGAELGRLVEQCANAGGVSARLEEIWYSPPLRFDEALVASVRRAAADAGLSHRDIVSGAGHDACYLAGICPTAMVFIPCRSGVSHNTAEYAEPAAIEAGTQVLLGAVLEAAGRVG